MEEGCFGGDAGGLVRASAIYALKMESVMDSGLLKGDCGLRRGDALHVGDLIMLRGSNRGAEMGIICPCALGRMD